MAASLGAALARRPRQTAGRPSRGAAATAAFHTDRVILAELQAAVASVRPGGRRAERKVASSSALSPARRALVLQLGLDVLVQGIVSGRAECDAIVAAAERSAAAIVREASGDVERLSLWLGRREEEVPPQVYPPLAPDANDVAVPAPPQAAPNVSGWDLWEASDAALVDLFFATADEDEDRWAFMDDDELVGVGRGLLRRFRRAIPARGLSLVGGARD